MLQKREYEREYYQKNKGERCRYVKEWNRKNKSKKQRIAQKSYLKIKLKILNHYSNNKLVCNCCGESHLEFLAVDHMKNNGTNHRKSVGNGNMFFHWLIKNNFPKGFQILCTNCNVYKGRAADHLCIHQHEKLELALRKYF